MNTDRFKFRVWDNEGKCYSTACFFIFGEGELFVFIGGVFHKANKERYTVEQCTGLKDENGKLIFEGDKIGMTHFYFDGCGESERNFIGYVMWNKGEFVLSKNQEKPEYENETEIIPHLSWGDSFEIIGNIHDGEKRT